MKTKTKISMDEATIQKINEALEKQPIGQEKLKNAQKLVEKGVLSLENIENTLKKTKKSKI
jgi:hypothetical protein